jgi:hypothetical protein
MANTVPTNGKLYANCSDAERLAYLNAYLATGDVESVAQAKFDTLADNALNDVDRSSYMASSLETQRDLELLKNQYRAFVSGASPVTPPDDDTVRRIQDSAAALAKVIATTETAGAILTILTQAKSAFDSMNPVDSTQPSPV